MTNAAPMTWRERLVSPLTWHVAGVVVLAIVVVGLGVRLGMDWSATNGSSTDALKNKQVQLKTLEIQTEPLRGLDGRVSDSRKEMLAFYAKRIPPNYSTFASRIGDLGVKTGVRLTRVAYAQGKPIGDLTEISMEAGVSGEYPQIMHFINGLERDQTFFVVRAMTLTGQQGGMVNLRLRVSTWLRSADAEASGIPTAHSEPETNPPTTPEAPEGQ